MALETRGRLRILSYNIHKGFSAANRNFILKRLKGAIDEVHADLVLLQEVLGQHDGHSESIEDWPAQSQFEFLADRLWPHFAYGKNAVYASGHHGNAILSKYPITFWENEDVSTSAIERRGLLHAVVEIPGLREPLHAFCVHLDLFERGRQAQLLRICDRIRKRVPSGAPLVVGGDFNDWRETATGVLERELTMAEVFRERTGRHARTFPSWFPLLRLDRLYARGLQCRAIELPRGGVWSELSDHLPIMADLDFAP